MMHEHIIQKYRYWYAKLLHLYSKSYYERFGEGMMQTFNDILRAQAKDGKDLFRCALWMFVETSGGIIKNNLKFMFMNYKRIIYVFAATAAILMVPLIAMQFTNEVDWSFMDFIVMGVLLSGTGLMYEFISRKAKNPAYKFAVGIAVLTGFLIIWVSLAVGIIGDDNPANMLYLLVLIIGFVGAIIVRFEPSGMARVLFITAVAQALVPVIAVIFWRDDFAPGVVQVFFLNAFFVMMFIASALLFRRSSINTPLLSKNN